MTQRYSMMGNAVTVNVIKAIGEKIGLKILNDSVSQEGTQTKLKS